MQVNVKDFGATGNGVTDDSTAFQTAMNLANTQGGVEIYIPSGQYRLGKQLQIYGNTKIVASKNAHMYRNNTGYLIVNGFRGSNVGGYNGEGNIEIDGGIWDGDRRITTGRASIFHFGHGYDISIRNVVMIDAPNSHHIEFNGCKKVRVYDSEFKGVARNSFDSNEAIQFDISKRNVYETVGRADDTPCEDAVVENCYFHSGIIRGVGSHTTTSTRPHKNIVVRNNIFENIESWAIRGYNWDNAIIEGNKIHNSGYGINLRSSITGVDTEDPNGVQRQEPYFNGLIQGNDITGRLTKGRAIEVYGESNSGKAYNVEVVNNKIELTHSTSDGIYLRMAEQCVVSNNVIKGAGNHAIRIANSVFDVNVLGNLIDNSGGSGISLEDVYYVNVSGNNVRRSYSHGIYVSGGESHVIADNIISGVNGRKGDGNTFNHVRIVNGALRVTVTGNLARNYSSTYVSTRAVTATSACQFVIVSDNLVRGFSIDNSATGSTLDARGNLT